MSQQVIYNFIHSYTEVTGVHKVAVSINKALRNDYKIVYSSFDKYEDVNSNLSIKKEEFVKLKFLRIKRNSIIILHERRMVLLFRLVSFLLFLHLKIVYIHHSQLSGMEMIPILANKIVAISDAGINNLINDLHVERSKIVKINNCVADQSELYKSAAFSCDTIQILLAGRICDVKRQIDIFKCLQGQLPEHIKIIFAGDGPDLPLLKTMIKDNPNFLALGFRDDVLAIMQNCQYIMLYSKFEGLPISLIEGTMLSLPIICNKVGGNTEIAQHKRNAFVVNSGEELLSVIQNLPNVTKDNWTYMSKESRKIYEENFTENKFKSMYVKLIQSLEN